MTLILSLANQDYAMVVSDRRLTINGKLEDDESNKAIIFACDNARLAAAFTGLAAYGTFRTDDWLVDALFDAAAQGEQKLGRTDVAPILENIRQRASFEIGNLRGLGHEHIRLTVVFTGFTYGAQGAKACSWQLSNFNTATNFELQEIHDPPDGILFQPDGASHGLDRSDALKLKALLRAKKPASAIVGKAVEMIQAAARNLKSGGLVGKQCNSSVVPSAVDSDMIAMYHSALVSWTSPTANIVLYPSGGSLAAKASSTHVSLQLPPAIVPKIGRNAPCPCGSGVKFKKCHGPILGQTRTYYPMLYEVIRPTPVSSGTKFIVSSRLNL